MASVTIIGCGIIGQYVALELLKKNFCKVINLVDPDNEYAQGLALDLNQANQVFCSHTIVKSRDMSAHVAQNTADDFSRQDPRDSRGSQDRDPQAPQDSQGPQVPRDSRDPQDPQDPQDTSLTIVTDPHSDTTNQAQSNAQSQNILDTGHCTLYARSVLGTIQSYAYFTKLIDVHGMALATILRSCVAHSLAELSDFTSLDTSSIHCQFFLDNKYQAHLKPEWIRVNGLNLSHCSVDAFEQIKLNFAQRVQEFLNAQNSYLLLAQASVTIAQSLLLGTKIICPVVDINQLTEIFMSPALISIDGVERFFDSEVVFSTTKEGAS